MAKDGRDDDGEIGEAGVAGGLDAACKARKYGAISNGDFSTLLFNAYSTLTIFLYTL